MKTLLFVTAATALALVGAAGCAPGGKAVARTALDCPARQGELTRTAMTADRKSCTYLTADGAQVDLQLIPVTGDADSTLRALEATLVAPAAESVADAAKSADQAAKSADEAGKSADEAVKSATVAAKDAEAVASDAEEAAAEAAADAKAGKVDLDLPGVHVRTEGKTWDGGKESANVNLPGIHIRAGEENAQVRIGGMQINANGGEATVRIIREVRLRGEALSREKRGVRATYIYAGHDLPNGYRFVGYEAAGPKTGPLAVATVRSKAVNQHGDDAYPSVKKLVRLNGGV